MGTLSDKFKFWTDAGGHNKILYFEKDVKEFIKNLKEELIGSMRDANVIGFKRFKETIDNLAGDKLI